MANASYAFFVLAIAFIAIGFTGRRAFLFIGFAFLVVGLLRLRRSRTGG